MLLVVSIHFLMSVQDRVQVSAVHARVESRQLLAPAGEENYTHRAAAAAQATFPAKHSQNVELVFCWLLIVYS